MILLRNPHAVSAAIEKRPADVQCVVEGRDVPAWFRAAWEEVFALARDHEIPVRPVPGSGSGSVQPRCNVKPREPTSIEEVFRRAPSRSGGPGRWLLLDRVAYRSNVGTIIRSAAFFGADGVIIHSDEPIIDAEVYDHACGGMEYVDFAVADDLRKVFDMAHGAGVSVLATDSKADRELDQVERARRWLIVLGNEEAGVSEISRARADVFCRIPAVGMRTCLNVGVTAGIFLAALAPGRASPG